MCLLTGGLTQSLAHAQDHSSGNEKLRIDPSKPELIPLVVRDFEAWDQVEKASYPADLLRAVPDTLYLYLLGNPRLGVTRGPSLPHTTSAATPANQPTASSVPNPPNSQIPKPQGYSYSLEGQIRVVPIGNGGASATLGDGGIQLLSVRYQLFGKELRPVAEGSFVTGSGDLPEHLAEIARLVGNKVTPAEAPVSVYLPSVETSCFSSDTENRFYEETLSGLLRTTLAGTDFVKLATAPTGAYVVRETAKPASHGCLVSATLTGATGETLVADAEDGAAADVLQIQSRLNQKIIDALHIESSSTGKKTALPDTASAKEYMQAGDKYRQTDPELAVALYRKALSLDATNKDVVKRLAQSLLDANRPEEVVALIRDPTNVSQYQLLASAYLKIGDDGKVFHELNEGLQLGSADRDFYLNASNILEQIGKYEAAANALEIGAIHAQPPDELAAMANETLRRGAKTLIVAGKNKEALPLVLASLKKEPKSEWGQRLAGIAYIDLKDPVKGEEYLQAAMRLQPTVYSEVELGDLRNTQKRYAEARTYAEQAIETDPTWVSGFATLSDSVQNAQDAAEVTAWLEKYVKMVPPNRFALILWTFIQTKYLPLDAAATHQQYLAYKAATKDVPYAEWTEGWTDLVELSMLDNHIEEAGHLANALLGVNLSQEHRMSMGFYSWLTYLLLDDCKRFETNLNTSLEFLRSNDVPEKNTWDFTATRKFVADRKAQGRLNSKGMALITAGLKLQEDSITPASIQQFNDLASQYKKEACPAN